ncbi:VOC family protein [Ferrimonas pelagia]|uniref:VOC family protein n=1 Tax=Ferrimonas pelagia TaxID=1177826 RepID=A0ABP9FHF0_9GAMM
MLQKISQMMAIMLLAISLPSQADFPPLAYAEADHAQPGKATWHDLFSSDPQASARFYQTVFGWQIAALDSEPYWLFYHDNQAIAGIVMRQENNSERVGAMWVPHFSRADLSEASRLPLASRWLMPPRNMGQRGVQAIAQDPNGAVFGLLASQAGDPLDYQPQAGHFAWHMLFSPDPKRSGEYYRDLLQIELSEQAPEWLLSSEGISRASISASESNDQGAPALWVSAIYVTEPMATAQTAIEAGATWLLEPQNDQEILFMIDPVGAIFGLIGPTDREEATQ